MFKSSGTSTCETCKGKRVIIIFDGREQKTITCPACIGSGRSGGLQTKQTKS